MSARDLADTVRRVLDALCDEATLGIDESEGLDAVAATCLEGQTALAALLKQAADAPHTQHVKGSCVPQWDYDRMEARAVRAEEALRLIAGAGKFDPRFGWAGDECARVAAEALAASGADTP